MIQLDCLIVDDEPDIRELLELTLARMGLSTASTGTLSEARNELSSKSFRLCLTDMRLPDGDGIELVEDISEKWPDMPVAVITAHGNMELAIKALKNGAFDFVSKPVDLKVLRNLVETALKLTGSNDNLKVSKAPSGDLSDTPELFGSSTAIEAIRKMTTKLARSQAPVHISGESGTGKELAARMIHAQGPRSDHAFVAVNCGAIPQELMESEFFGHVKGSFTGAIADKSGLFQVANHGTLFLDEIADLPMIMQVKLLRAIQEKTIRPIGGTNESAIDVRIISATHKNLQQLVEEGLFRQDLYYRVNVIELNLPALREHTEDLPGLIDFCLDKICQKNDIPKPEIQGEAMQALISHHYPGNVRELENILEGALALHEDNRVVAKDLKLSRTTPVPASATFDGTLEQQVEHFEKQIIENALNTNQWNRTAAANQLGISLRQLRYKLEKLGLDKQAE
ncbi:MAG: sigma-54 dependent transcriptional regulator [Gammaproteobacteria bacterium]|nr:sigma-54 dependent transcriptional regulator [Gammaproteobacteria bacterium]